MHQLVQQLQQQLAEQELVISEKDSELSDIEEAAAGSASSAHMWELAYKHASKQQLIYMEKYEVSQAELETVTEALETARNQAGENSALCPPLFDMPH